MRCDTPFLVVPALVLALTVPCHAGSAEPLFVDPVFGVGDTPMSVAVGDFDADGRQDLVTANRESDDVSVLLGRGDGDFEAESRFSVGEWPRSVAVGDFDGDGRQDLVTANYESDDLSILLGDGHGGFAAEQRVVVGPKPSYVVVGRFDAGDTLDLAVNTGDCTLSTGTCDISVVLGNGDGTFGPDARYPAGWCADQLALGDFDHDGDVDLVQAAWGCGNNIPPNPGSSLSVLMGNGDGTFAPRSRMGGRGLPKAVAVGDIDDDGNQDLVVGNWGADISDAGVTVRPGNGDGTFGYSWPIRWVDVDALAIGEFDGDGVPDLAVAGMGQLDSEMTVWLGTGDGSFVPESSYWGGLHTNSVVTGEFNQDGKQDLAAVGFSQQPGLVRVLLNQGPSNRPPTADAGEAAQAECVAGEGSVILDGSGSSDPDSTPGTNDDIELFEWFAELGLPGERLLGSGESLDVALDLGVHLVTLRVTDRAGETEIDEVWVSVVDTTAPVVSCSAATDTLWPPNHGMIDIGWSHQAVDACDEAEPVLGFVVSSDEHPAGASGAGGREHCPDAEIAADGTLLLRAERSGGGDGRVYQVRLTATDAGGNQAACSAAVGVPRSRGRGGDAVDSGQNFDATTCETDPAASSQGAASMERATDPGATRTPKKHLRRPPE